MRVVGLKPTHSLVPYTGIGGIDQTFDHAGPMARSVSDVAQTLEVIAGKDPLDPRQYDVPVQSYAQPWGVTCVACGLACRRVLARRARSQMWRPRYGPPLTPWAL